jgi:hypothetical protein
MTTLTTAQAAQFMALTTGHLTREYPHKLDHVLDGPEDVLSPKALHPIFHGSFDWHSCVHGWWQVLRLARLHPDLPEAAKVRDLAETMFTSDNWAAETAYLDRTSARGFERPYGWAWALALHGEMVLHGAEWAHRADPFAANFAARFRDFLPLQTYPIRVGTHYNSAFALTLAHQWAVHHDPELLLLIERCARSWFLSDRSCQAWEPGGDEFLSSALCEAMLMSLVLARDEFAQWFGEFLPDADCGRPLALFEPAYVSDRSDGKIAHLDGLNLSRAWCWRRIASRLTSGQLTTLFAATAKVHLDAALPHLADDYMGEHWLASFALLALTA